MADRKEVVLKVSKTSNSKSLASAIAHEIVKEDVSVHLRAIGVQAITQAVKAIAISGGFLGQQGYSVYSRIGFTEVSVQDHDVDKITAVKFILFLKK